MMNGKDLTLVMHHPHHADGPPPENAAASVLASQTARHQQGVTMRHVLSPHFRMISLSLALVVLTLFGLASPASAGDQVPFSSSGTGAVTGVTRLPGGIIQVDESSAGTATYLGDYTGTSTGLVDQQGNFTVTGCLVGANGKDSVCYIQRGRLERTQGKCVTTATGPYTVTGGTGAFANATGGGTYTGQHDSCSGLFSGSLTGTISQPNSG
ncbi:MAG TPA: hypothetical protein PKE45_00110 [Caldilineaceae bacterium]|nr:hypothetical protein [Caldilineaceae bacterium]